MQYLDLNNLDQYIHTQQDAINVAISILTFLKVSPNDFVPLIRNGVASVSLAKAIEIACKSQKLIHFAKTISANTGNRTFHELLGTGEGALIMLCMEIKVTKNTADLDGTWEHIIRAKPSETEQMPHNKWWRFWG